jgi:hypothetical protein
MEMGDVEEVGAVDVVEEDRVNIMSLFILGGMLGAR